MTKAILFRGYYPDENRWVYGYYVKLGEVKEWGYSHEQ